MNKIKLLTRKELETKYLNCLTDLGYAKFDIKQLEMDVEQLKKRASEILVRYKSFMEIKYIDSKSDKDLLKSEIKDFKNRIEEI